MPSEIGAGSDVPTNRIQFGCMIRTNVHRTQILYFLENSTCWLGTDQWADRAERRKWCFWDTWGLGGAADNGMCRPSPAGLKGQHASLVEWRACAWAAGLGGPRRVTFVGVLAATPWFLLIGSSVGKLGWEPAAKEEKCPTERNQGNEAQRSQGNTSVLFLPSPPPSYFRINSLAYVRVPGISVQRWGASVPSWWRAVMSKFRRGSCPVTPGGAAGQLEAAEAGCSRELSSVLAAGPGGLLGTLLGQPSSCTFKAQDPLGTRTGFERPRGIFSMLCFPQANT